MLSAIAYVDSLDRTVSSPLRWPTSAPSVPLFGAPEVTLAYIGAASGVGRHAVEVGHRHVTDVSDRDRTSARFGQVSTPSSNGVSPRDAPFVLWAPAHLRRRSTVSRCAQEPEQVATIIITTPVVSVKTTR